MTMPSVRSVSFLANDAVGSTLVLNAPAGVVDGDYLVAVVFADVSTGALSVGAGGAAWGSIKALTFGTGGYMKVWAKFASAEPASYTFTASAATGTLMGGIWAVKNVDPWWGWDAAPASNIGTGPTFICPSATTARNRELVLTFFGAKVSTTLGSMGTITPPAGTTTDGAVQSALTAGGGSYMAGGHIEVAPAGATGTYTWTSGRTVDASRALTITLCSREQVQEQKTAESSSSTAVPTTTPSFTPTAAGNLLVVRCVQRSVAQRAITVGITDSAGCTWTEVGHSDFATTGVTTGVATQWWARAVGTSPMTVTLTPDEGYIVFDVMEVSGIPATGTCVGATAAGANAASMDAIMGLTTTKNNSLISTVAIDTASNGVPTTTLQRATLGDWPTFMSHGRGWSIEGPAGAYTETFTSGNVATNWHWSALEVFASPTLQAVVVAEGTSLTDIKQTNHTSSAVSSTTPAAIKSAAPLPKQSSLSGGFSAVKTTGSHHAVTSPALNSLARSVGSHLSMSAVVSFLRSASIAKTKSTTAHASASLLPAKNWVKTILLGVAASPVVLASKTWLTSLTASSAALSSYTRQIRPTITASTQAVHTAVKAIGTSTSTTQAWRLALSRQAQINKAAAAPSLLRLYKAASVAKVMSVVGSLVKAAAVSTAKVATSGAVAASTLAHSRTLRAQAAVRLGYTRSVGAVRSFTSPAFFTVKTAASKTAFTVLSALSPSLVKTAGIKKAANTTAMTTSTKQPTLIRKASISATSSAHKLVSHTQSVTSTLVTAFRSLIRRITTRRGWGIYL